MTNYVWFPVFGLPPTGETITATDTLTWDAGTFNWNTPSFWVDAPSAPFTGNAPPTGTVPDSGTGTSQGADDSVGLVAGSISAAALFEYNELAPFLNDPQIASTDLSIDILLNTGTVDLTDLLMAGVAANVADTPQVLPQYPTLDVEGANLFVSTEIVNTDSTDVPGRVGEESATGGGTIDIGSGGTVEAGGSVQTDIFLNFMDSASDTLRLDALSTIDTVAFAGTITDFGAGDTIWLPNVPLSLDGVITTATYDTTNKDVVLSIGDPVQITIDLAGSGLTASNSVQVISDGRGGVDLVTCFAAGTRIATRRGEVPVEELRADDCVEVVHGEKFEPVVWIGRRHLDCRRHVTPQHAWPVRVRAGAFGAGRPYRDLWLSPDHAVYANDVLIPVKCLVNGRTIEQVTVNEIDYYHVELPRHGVLLANGLPVESFLDVNENRGFFANGDAPTALHPNLTALAWEANGCAPLVVTGPELDAVRDFVSRLADVEPTAAAA
jgi:hypothetical protein